MWKALLIAILLAGCAQLPPSPADLQARRFEAVPDKAVIYLVRDYPDFNDSAATLWLGETAMITTYPGTYYRWEVAPGQHRISGYGHDVGAIIVRAEAGRLYFVMQRLAPFMRFPSSQLHLIAEPAGRAAVMRSVLVGGQ
ncbi:MAG: hypothetical protein HYY78_02065 [Betaproteobacteria bacterium]|nr:hypothetical protein [Betaproteobacteria bacterium]